MLEFAYELDYEKYMEDSEVRMALAVIKDRVGSLAKEENWQDNMVEAYNNVEGKREKPARIEVDQASHVSYSK